ncbi:4Fe-4S dicluster domain-containing protein [Candidatus Sumerlaeota bacterium]|nr:4Fe-4S dicluster domain-containing protein [Candidatus Sumerlaeota bacterium]
MKSENSESATRPRVVIHAELCKGCRRCVVSCPAGVLEMTSQLNALGYTVAGVAHAEKCTACGLCFYVCPEPGGVSVFGEEPVSSEVS